MSRFSGLEKKYPLSSWRLFGLVIIALIAGFLVWVNFAEFEEVAVLSGEVVPQDHVKVVQHLEGGIIQKIHVREGSRVEQGAPLMQLDLAVNAINEEALKIQLESLRIKRARLIAESEGAAPVYPASYLPGIGAVLEAEKKTYASRMAQLEAKRKIMEEIATQKALDVEQLQLKYAALKSDLAVSRRKFAMSRELLDANLTPKIEHLQLEIELTRLEGELKSLKPALPRAEAAAKEARERVREEELGFRRMAFDELGATEREIARLKELLVTAGEQVTRTTIRSPIDGIVKNLRINTVGGIVRPGDAVMDIVPSSDKLVVEARLNPADRGFVRVGQEAMVKLTSYDYFTYGGLKGKVANIAADASSDENGNPYFKVIVETDEVQGPDQGGFLVTPGMQALVDIHTGRKPVIDYLLQPVLKLRHESFRER
ncbi:HlyD family type I secretion periplasmic adaptor subunit [Sneathiella chinensis]|uniref:Membrane fusion protein (MFP) family protein n=1 Tax=Sneathiella chinensis TaxID=349750 RepID=A0ABQ5U675_9PROT|nr:HlyD family type I secretion periplasmic adaptor subunit [Sneathiella chinensis]GLQ07190.1 HlyD family type I secretion membrane fusion protein [Sneathiella chinensis]